MEHGLLDLMSLKPFDQISVSDLCEYMQIPRKSFYRYFSNKEDTLHALLDHTMLEYDGFFTAQDAQDPHILERALTQFFQFWISRKQLLDALANNDLSAILVERAILHMASDSAKSSHIPVDHRQYIRKQVSLFCISGLMSVVLSWHRDGFPYSAEQMASITATLVSQPMYPNLRTYF